MMNMTVSPLPRLKGSRQQDVFNPDISAWMICNGTPSCLQSVVAVYLWYNVPELAILIETLDPKA